MKLLHKLFTAILFIAYLFALSQAAFGGQLEDSLVRTRAKLINTDILEAAQRLDHKCSFNGEAEMKIEVLVDSRGVVRAFHIADCPDEQFRAELRDKVMHLLFVPAFSIVGKPIPSTVTFTLVYRKRQQLAEAIFSID